MPYTDQDLEKAKAKSLASHFKKVAAFHEKKADHHEKCMKAHDAAAAHHESMMGKAEDASHSHHKAKAAFHKTMSGHHEKAQKLHKAHAEHHEAMAAAHAAEPAGNADHAKAAFATLGIDLEKTTTTTDPVPPVAAPPVADPAPVVPAAPVVAAAAVPDPQPNPTGDATMSKTAAELAAVVSNDPENPLQKQLSEGLSEALRNGLKEALANPEFKKSVQEQIGNMLISELGKQTPVPSQIKTFAVPRSGPDATQVATIRAGGAPSVDSAGVDPQFAHLLKMD